MGITARPKLTQATLATVAGRVAVPTYDRNRLAPAIVHIGVGGFHRAHQAVYLDDLAAQGITLDWGEHGVGLLPADKAMAAALIPQDCLYTLVARGAAGDTARVIGSMTAYLFAPDDRARVLDLLAAPTTRIVSLTITEGGYNVDSHTGRFDAAHPVVQADLHHPDQPSSVFGYLCAALDRRHRAGTPPFTVLSCDNLQGNGMIARTAVTSFARLRDDRLAAWIEAHVAFPNAMVDRITPQTTDADRAFVAETFGITDAWPVMTEPFTQWVLEDTFCNGRPPLEQGRPHRLLTLAVTGWIRYLRGVDEEGREIAIADRLASELRERANAGWDNPRPVLGLGSVFGDLGSNERFVSELGATLRELDTGGAKATLGTYLAAPPA